MDIDARQAADQATRTTLERSPFLRKLLQRIDEESRDGAWMLALTEAEAAELDDSHGSWHALNAMGFDVVAVSTGTATVASRAITWA